jgi:hypothetical protein
MSLQAKLDADSNAALWAERQEWGRGPRHARDKWALTTMERCGDLTGEQSAAALLLAKLIEKSNPGGTSNDYDRVSAGSPDYHARMRVMVLSGQQAESASRFMLGHMQRDAARRVVVRAWEYPHPTMRELMDEYSEGSKNTDRVKSILAHACDLLAVYFDGVDREITHYGEKASIGA